MLPASRQNTCTGGTAVLLRPLGGLPVGLSGSAVGSSWCNEMGLAVKRDGRFGETSCVPSRDTPLQNSGA
jgi:hypothetical protein